MEDLRKMVDDALVVSNAALESFCSARDVWAAAARASAPEAPALERKRKEAWKEYSRRWREYNSLYYKLREVVMRDAPVIFC